MNHYVFKHIICKILLWGITVKYLFIGCCGIPVSRAKYFSELKVIELQNTFYDLFSEEEAKRFRKRLPEDIVVCIKAWQVITHPYTSPTWKKMKRKPKGVIENYGYLRPTKENFEAWENVLAIAKILNSRAIVLQTPPSFNFNDENLSNAYQFFSAIKRNDMIIAWEPRGTWRQARSAIEKIVDLGIVHVTDILREDPVDPEKTRTIYSRLHGLGPREVNYKYRYTDDDLKQLISKILVHVEKVREIFIMFNNIYMFEDSRRFKNLFLEYIKHTKTISLRIT